MANERRFPIANPNKTSSSHAVRFLPLLLITLVTAEAQSVTEKMLSEGLKGVMAGLAPVPDADKAEILKITADTLGKHMTFRSDGSASAICTASGKQQQAEWKKFVVRHIQAQPVNEADRLNGISKRYGDDTINHPAPYRRLTAELLEDPALLIGLNEVDYAKMSMDDPLLKLAYCNVFMRAVGNFQSLEPMEALALADMRRRGDAVTPMLLKLAKENQETGFEIRLLGMVEQVGSITLDPYIKYARSLLQERTQTMNATAASVASSMLAKHGSKPDIELLKKVLEERPYVADDVTRNLRSLEQRLKSQQQESSPSQKERTSPVGTTTDSVANSGQRISTVTSGEESITKHWIVWGLLIAAVTSLLWLLLKKNIKRGR